MTVEMDSLVRYLDFIQNLTKFFNLDTKCDTERIGGVGDNSLCDGYLSVGNGFIVELRLLVDSG